MQYVLFVVAFVARHRIINLIVILIILCCGFLIQFLQFIELVGHPSLVFIRRHLLLLKPSPEQCLLIFNIHVLQKVTSRRNLNPFSSPFFTPTLRLYHQFVLVWFFALIYLHSWWLWILSCTDHLLSYNHEALFAGGCIPQLIYVLLNDILYFIPDNYC